MNTTTVNSLVLLLAACSYLTLSQPVFASASSGEGGSDELTSVTGAIIVHPQADDLAAIQVANDRVLRAIVWGPDSYAHRTLVVPILRAAYKRTHKDFTSILPAELAVETLMCLDPPTLLRLAKVSRRCKRLAEDNHVWRTMARRYYNPPKFVVNYKSYLALIHGICRQLDTVIRGGQLNTTMILQYLNENNEAFANRDVCLYVQGILCEAEGRSEEAFQLYLQSNLLLARKRVNEAIYEGHLGQGSRPEAERFAYLESRATAGDKNAQELVNDAIYKGNLGQGSRPEAERFAYLADRAAEEDVHAQNLVNVAIYKGDLGQGSLPDAERHAYLETRAAKGDVCAQELLNGAIYFCKFGQSRSRAECFAELAARASEGNVHAQVLVNAAICNGDLGQSNVDATERFAYLESRATEGDKNAQEWVNAAIYHGYLDQLDRPEAERFAELAARAAAGDKDAQDRVNEAIYRGYLDQRYRPEAERFAELAARAAAGDKDAQDWVNEAIYEGVLGQSRSKVERLADLIARAAAGDTNAQEFTIAITGIDPCPSISQIRWPRDIMERLGKGVSRRGLYSNISDQFKFPAANTVKQLYKILNFVQPVE